jgi:mannose/fructose-specific phosphotransferase system component IIA
MKKAAIPTLQSGNSEIDRFAEAVKQNLETMTGQQKNVGRLDPLPTTASLQDVIARCNLLLDRLQGS